MTRRIIASLLPGTGSKKQLFRPVQPTELTTPCVAMIMYQLYWSKYLLFLRTRGVNLSDSQAVSRCLYSAYPSSGDAQPEMGIIAKCAWVKAKLGGEINTFDRFLTQGPTGWLFEDSDWYTGLVTVSKHASSGNEDEASEILRGVLGTRVRGILRDKGKDASDLLEAVRSRGPRDEKEHLTVLSDEIGRMLTGKFHKGFPLWFNFNFTRDCICDGIIEVDSPSLKVLANDQYYADGYEGLSETERISLLDSFGRTRNGRVLLLSMAIDRFLRESRKTDEHEFSSCYLTVKDATNSHEIIELIQDRIRDRFSNTEDLLRTTALGWDLNVFLYVGESIARYMIRKSPEHEEGVVTLELNEISKALRSDISSDYVQNCSTRFVESINQIGRDSEMRRMIGNLSKYLEDRRFSLSRHLSTLVRNVERNIPIERTFANLCALNEDVDFNGRTLEFHDFDPADAVFTGYGVFQDWSKNLFGRA